MIIHWSKASENHYSSAFVQLLAVYTENTYLLTVNESVSTGTLALQVAAEGLVMALERGRFKSSSLESPLPIVCSGLKILEGRLLFYNEDDPSVHISLLYIGKMQK